MAAPHETLCDTEVEGYFIPKGTIVSYCLSVLYYSNKHDKSIKLCKQNQEQILVCYIYNDIYMLTVISIYHYRYINICSNLDLFWELRYNFSKGVPASTQCQR